MNHTMSYYEKEINRIRSICYSNKGQIETVTGIKNFIDQHFDEELNLDMLSCVLYTSKFHLLRLFKRYYGLTPNQYLTNKRIEKAKKHLREGMTVTETCFSVGFGSPSSFSTLFKSKAGFTPTEFQKKSNFHKAN